MNYFILNVIIVIMILMECPFFISLELYTKMNKHTDSEVGVS